jgi:transposase InsO family protein
MDQPLASVLFIMSLPLKGHGQFQRMLHQQSGYNERFNGTLRREVFNAEWFSTIKQAQIVINIWLKKYNTVRPRQALNMRPPVPEALHRPVT